MAGAAAFQFDSSQTSAFQAIVYPPLTPIGVLPGEGDIFPFSIPVYAAPSNSPSYTYAPQAGTYADISTNPPSNEVLE